MRRLPDQPFVRRAVLEQQHARQRPPHPLLAMRRALRRHAHQAAALQHRLRPSVAQIEAVLGLQGLVEVLHREVEVAGPVLLDHPFDPIRRHPAPGSPAAPTVDQPFRSFRLVALAQPAEMPLADPQKLRRLQAAQTSGSMPLQSLQIARHAHLRSHSDPPGLAAFPNRTNRLLQKPDISSATDNRRGTPCYGGSGCLNVISEHRGVLIAKPMVPVRGLLNLVRRVASPSTEQLNPHLCRRVGVRRSGSASFSIKAHVGEVCKAVLLATATPLLHGYR